MTETTTPDRTVLTGKILSQAAFTATIDAPIGKIDIAGWLRTLADREYQRCAPPRRRTGSRGAGRRTRGSPARTAAAAAGTSASPGQCSGPPASRDRTGPQRQYAVAS
jgi:hypothetical protein